MDDIAKAKVKQLLGELAGAASVCWRPKPSGVFEPDLAAYFVNTCFEKLEKIWPKVDPQTGGFLDEEKFSDRGCGDDE